MIRTRISSKISTIEVNDGLGQRLLQLRRSIVFLRCNDGQEIEVKNSYDPRESVLWCVQVMAQANYCFLVNLGTNAIQLPSITHTKLLSPEATERVTYGEEVRLDNFSFIFHRKRISDLMELDFSLPPELTHQHTEETPLEGTITLHNKGSEAKVQFQITHVEGLGDNSYRLDSRQPKLVHTRDRTVNIAFYHPSGEPIPAGRYSVGIYAKADTYPGEVADFQEVYVRPFYEHMMDYDVSQ